MELKDNILEYLKSDPYEISVDEKREKFLDLIKLQTRYHLDNCLPYRNWYLDNNFISPEEMSNIAQVPFIPSSAFKFVDLSSSNNDFKTIKSSGTSSQMKSQIFLDNNTSKNQTVALSKILSSNLDKKRKHFFIIDIEPDKNDFKDLEMTARYAGMQGYLMAAKKRTYLLKKNVKGELEFDEGKLSELLTTSSEESVVVIGYTYMLWQYLVNSDLKKIDLSSSKLIHFGGWKKLSDQKVDKAELVEKLTKKTSIDRNNILDIYGFTEQLGTVYVSRGISGCRASSYSEVLVRDTDTFELVEDGKEGFLQFLSILPLSYPGFSILNDDLGRITNRGETELGHSVLEFEVLSRLEKAESRGCGDTLPPDYYL